MKVFVSHISKEKKLAMVFKGWIETTFLGKISVFVSSDPQNIPLGNKWREDITSALDESKLLIILYSPISRNRPWISFEAGCGWIKRIPVIPICHSSLKLKQIGEPISSFQGIELDDKEFTDKFFAAIAKHSGFAKVPKIDKNQFLKEIKEALDSFDSIYVSVEESKKNNFTLSEEQNLILKTLADAEDRQESGVDEPILAGRVNMRVTMLIHHVTHLIDRNFVHHGSVMGGPSV